MPTRIAQLYTSLHTHAPAGGERRTAGANTVTTSGRQEPAGNPVLSARTDRRAPMPPTTAANARPATMAARTVSTLSVPSRRSGPMTTAPRAGLGMATHHTVAPARTTARTTLTTAPSTT